MPKSDIGLQVGQRLRDVRKRAGLTQPELGERAHMAAAEISKIENGRRTPTLETLERLAAALGVAVHDLVATDARPEGEHGLVEQLSLRLQGQPPELLRRIAAVVDALLRAG